MKYFYAIYEKQKNILYLVVFLWNFYFFRNAKINMHKYAAFGQKTKMPNFAREISVTLRFDQNRGIFGRRSQIYLITKFRKISWKFRLFGVKTHVKIHENLCRTFCQQISQHDFHEIFYAKFFTLYFWVKNPTNFAVNNFGVKVKKITVKKSV